MAAFPSIPEPPFESAAMQELVWGGRWGCTTDVGRLRAVLVHRPGPEIDQIVVHAHGEARRAVKIRTIDLHPDDHPFTINGLAVRPGRVLMSEASRHTLDRLAKEGIEVIPLAFDAVYRGGGIHCSTAPLARDPV